VQGTEIEATTVPSTNGEAPLLKRQGSRDMLPSTWQGRSLRVEESKRVDKGEGVR
jgi:hypothetical protein